MFLTTTSCCILPIGRYNGKPLSPVPGPVTVKLTQAFSKHVGVDFVAQAAKLASEKVAA